MACLSHQRVVEEPRVVNNRRSKERVVEKPRVFNVLPV